MSEPRADTAIAPTAVETLSLETFERERTRGGLTVFPYTPNSRGFIFLQICAGLLFLIAFMIYMATGFSPTYWIPIAGAITLGGLTLIGIVGYWTWFARTSAVAFDEHHLYVLRLNKPVRIGWRHLTAQAAGFADEHPDGNHGVLNMHLGNQKVSLVLFNPFVVVEDFPGFLVELLTQIKRNHALTEGVAPSSGDETRSGDEPPAA